MKPLSAAQRAFIQLAESMVITSFIAGLISIVPLLNGTTVSWQQVGFAFAIALLFSLAHSVVAYLRPSQPDMAAAIEGVVEAFEKRLATVQLPVNSSTSAGLTMIPIQPRSTTQQSWQGWAEATQATTQPQIPAYPPIMRLPQAPRT